MSTHAFYKLIPRDFARSTYIKVYVFHYIPVFPSFFIFCCFRNFNAISFNISFIAYNI